MAIENTSHRNPLIHLAGAIGSSGSEGYIEEMEAAGQRQLVLSDRLPTDCHSPDDELHALGFTLGEPDPADPMFRHATLPDGWTREGSDHAMWSHLLDSNGRRRASIFYKAAFYHRSAHWSLITPAGYVSDLLWSEDPDPIPTIDDWTTREVLVEAVTAAKARETREIDEWREREQRRGDDGSCSEIIGRRETRVARCDALLAKLTAGGAA